MIEKVLEVKALSYTYTDSRKSEGYTVAMPELVLERGQVAALTGASGCGKSTVLECLGGLRNRYSCELFRLGSYDLGCNKDELNSNIRSALIGYMPQSYGLISYLNIEQNIKLQIEVSNRARKRLSLKEQDEKKLFSKALQFLENLSLDGFLKKMPDTLSNGQKQRAVFVKSIAHCPELLLIDEPTSALDPEHGKKLFSDITRLCTEERIAALIVTHDLGLVKENNLKEYVFKSSSENSGLFT
ncbi:MAG: ATP-binding cassette domain-containing protein [Succinivibrio sp.]